MSKSNSISWRKQDTKKLANVVRTFNAKITRTLKKNPELAQFLPERLTTSEIKERINTRADFNRELKSYQRFMKKGAEMPLLSEQGIMTTAWEKREIGLKVAQINRARTLERKRADVSTEKGTMGSIEGNMLIPKAYNFDKIKKSDWEHYKQSVFKQAKSTYFDEKYIKYRENYIVAIQNVFGSMGDDIIEKVLKIDPKTFTKMYYDDPVLQIDFIYDPHELEFVHENILEHFEEYTD